MAVPARSTRGAEESEAAAVVVADVVTAAADVRSDAAMVVPVLAPAILVLVDGA